MNRALVQIQKLHSARLASTGSQQTEYPRNFTRRAMKTIGSLFLCLTLSVCAQAAQLPVALNSADTFSVLGASTVTNTGPTTVNGNLGVGPGSAVTGFPPGIVVGTVHVADGPAAAAQGDLTTAYNDAAGRTVPAIVAGDLGGLTLT